MIAVGEARATGAVAGAVTTISVEAALMGGHVGIHVQPAGGPQAAERDAEQAFGALRRWVERLTRFDPASELSRLNEDARDRVPVGPTVAAVLDWGRAAETETDGIVNIAMLDHRLAAEIGGGQEAGQLVRGSDTWSIERGRRSSAVRRPVGLRFDLDGVAKGWLADRAAARLDHHRAVVVDADGDVAVHLGPGASWEIGVADAVDLDHTISTLRLAASTGRGRTAYGVATSGTSVHRWSAGGASGHHLIDPRSGRPAVTDVVQATVVAGSAREAEAFAKAAVILGSAHALASFDRPGVEALLILTDRRELLATPRSLRYMA